MARNLIVTLKSSEYTVNDGLYTIDLVTTYSGMTTTDLAYVYNKTQDVFYFGQAQGLAKASLSSGTITIDSISYSALASGDEIHIQIWTEDVATATIDTGTNSQQTSVLNPEWAHYTSVEHPVDALNQADATAFYQVFDMEGYRSAAIQLMGSNVTFTAYVTLSDNATDDDELDTQWVDITTSLFGGAMVTTTSESFIGWVETLRMPKKILIKYVTTSATNAADIWIRKY